MSLIAAQCCISKRTLYEIFPSKDALFVELAIRHRSNVVNLPGNFDHLSLEQALIEIFRVNRSDEEYAEQAAEVRLFFVEAVANPPLGAILKTHVGMNLHDQLTEWVQREAERGRLVTPSARDTAKCLVDVLVGAQIFRSDDPDDPSGISNVRTYMLNTIRSLVQGLAARP